MGCYVGDGESQGTGNNCRTHGGIRFTGDFDEAVFEIEALDTDMSSDRSQERRGPEAFMPSCQSMAGMGQLADPYAIVSAIPQGSRVQYEPMLTGASICMYIAGFTQHDAPLQYLLTGY